MALTMICIWKSVIAIARMRKDRSPFGDRLTCFRCPSRNSVRRSGLTRSRPLLGLPLSPRNASATRRRVALPSHCVIVAAYGSACAPPRFAHRHRSPAVARILSEPVRPHNHRAAALQGRRRLARLRRPAGAFDRPSARLLPDRQRRQRRLPFCFPLPMISTAPSPR